MKHLLILFTASLILCPGFLAHADDARPQLRFETSAGSFEVELFPDAAPATVANFLDYVAADFYEGLIFHRVIEGFVVQTGGYDVDMRLKEPGEDVVNESVGGPKNLRGTLAMARRRNPDSANAQFFVNLRANSHLDAVGDRPGYTVFGRVTRGMDVIDAISEVATGQRDGMPDVPVEPIVIEAVSRLDDGR